MKIETVKLNARGNHETVLAKRLKSGRANLGLCAKTYVNLTQANAAALKVGGEVIRPFRSRSFYVRVQAQEVEK